MLRLEIPEHAGSRPQAKELLSILPAGFAGQTVTVDCGRLLVPTPSFFDEVVKQVLVIGQAKRLDLTRPSARARDLAQRAAKNRGVSDRLSVLEPVS